MVTYDFGMEQIKKVLSGEAVEDPIRVHYTEIKDGSEKYVPICKRTVGYIVGAIIFNEANSHVLLIQEAKASCRGLWYYPVGRLEPNESLIEGVKREVKEEAGVDISPSKLLCIETSEASWLRYTFTGTITGELKSKPDKESLKAAWAPIQQILDGGGSKFPLRVPDFLHLILKKKEEVSCSLLPALLPQKKLLVRLLFVKDDANSSFSFLEKDGSLPVLEMDWSSSLKRSFHRFCEMAFGSATVFKILGVLSVEHSATPAHQSDGYCLTLLLSYVPPSQAAGANGPHPPNSQYQWKHLDQSDLCQSITSKFQTSNIVPLVSLR